MTEFHARSCRSGKVNTKDADRPQNRTSPREHAVVVDLVPALLAYRQEARLEDRSHAALVQVDVACNGFTALNGRDQRCAREGSTTQARAWRPSRSLCPADACRVRLRPAAASIWEMLVASKPLVLNSRIASVSSRSRVETGDVD